MLTAKRLTPLLILIACLTLVAGCATTGVQQCRPEFLKHPAMRFDFEKNRYVIDDHIYFSKEASGGGRGSSSGGCGCN